VDRPLNKKQLQETLRQMGIDYSPTASKEDLLKSLQLENQNQWMRLANGDRSFRSKRILRRKGGSIKPVSGEAHNGERIDTTPHRNTPVTRQSEKRSPYPEPIRKMELAELKPELELPGAASPPSFQSAKELEDYALKRANGVCDLCEIRIKETEDRLTACFFMDPPEGRQRTAKEVAALCPDCFNRVQSERLPKDIKILKRKARQKRIREVKISMR
jgi:hypothetical protein